VNLTQDTLAVVRGEGKLSVDVSQLELLLHSNHVLKRRASSGVNEKLVYFVGIGMLLCGD
jgi:hypothetical protein